MTRPILRFLYRALVFGGAAAMFVLAWTLAVEMTRGTRLPPLSQVWAGVQKMHSAGTYLQDIAVSLVRFLLGWLMGAALAIPAGLFTGREKRFLGPMLELNLNAQRAVPVIALAPLFSIWFGISELGKVLLVAWGTFFPVWVNTHSGVRSVNPNYLNAARSLGTKGPALWWRVLIPHVSEPILTGLRVSIGVGLICIVAAEIIGTFTGGGLFSGGLGYRLRVTGDLNLLDRMIACIITFGILGWVADKVFMKVVRPLVLLVAKFDPQRSTLRVGTTARG